AAGTAGLRARVAGRRQRFGLRPLLRGLWLARCRRQLCRGRGQPEDPGPARVVDAGEPARCLLAGRHRIRFPYAPARQFADRPARRRCFGFVADRDGLAGTGAMSLSWQMAALLLLGGSTVLLFLGLPVALSFVAINIVGAMVFLGGEPGLLQVVRNSVVSVMNFSL